jgi:Na+-driven multidrug efflux pump
LLSGLAGLGFYGALAGGGSLLARIFSSEAAVASNVKQFLWAGFAGLPFAGAWAAAGAALNAVGRPKSSLFLGAVGHLLPVPFLFYGTQLGGWWGFSLAMAISRCFSGVLAVEVLKRCALIAWPFAPARPATPNADESTVAVAEPLE